MRIPSKLKRAALAEFKHGGDWSRFIDQHGDQLRQTEPYDVSRYRTLRGKLLHLVVSGEASGEFGCGDDDAVDPWERDDAAQKPHDTHTAARYRGPEPTPLPGLVSQGTLFDVTEAYQ